MVYSQVNIQSQAYDYQPFETGAYYTPANTVYNGWERAKQLAGSFGSIFILLSTKIAKGSAQSNQGKSPAYSP